MDSTQNDSQGKNQPAPCSEDAQDLRSHEMRNVSGGFSRPAPAGDGTTEHFFTIEFSGGRIDR